MKVLLALAVGGFGLYGPPPASAGNCPVNVGTCGPTGNCTVNAGVCNGTCAVNLGTCEAGGTCLVNTGTCEGPLMIEGFGCGFTTITNPPEAGGQPDEQTGEIDGGPRIVVDESSPMANHALTMTCDLKVGSPGNYTAPADATASATGNNVVTIPQTLVSIIVPTGAIVSECETLKIDSTTYYRDYTVQDNPVWSTNAATSDCARATQVEIFPGPFAPVIDLLNQTVCAALENVGLVDPTLEQTLEDTWGDCVLS